MRLVMFMIGVLVAGCHVINEPAEIAVVDERGVALNGTFWVDSLLGATSPQLFHGRIAATFSDEEPVVISVPDFVTVRTASGAVRNVVMRAAAPLRVFVSSGLGCAMSGIYVHCMARQAAGCPGGVAVRNVWRKTGVDGWADIDGLAPGVYDVELRIDPKKRIALRTLSVDALGVSTWLVVP